MIESKGRSLKLKASKYCTLDNALYWKDPGGILLNCLNEAQEVMNDFHRGDCGGHIFWKTMVNKVLRAGCYWPTLFLNLYKIVIELP